MTKRLLTMLTILAATLGLALAQEESEAQQNQNQQQQQQEPRAAVRIAHLGVDGPTLRVTVGEQDAFSGVGPETVSDYMLLPAGTQQVEVVQAEGQQGQEGQNQDGQEGQDGQQVQQGQVPQELMDAIDAAVQAVQGDGDAQSAVDEALSQVESAIENADAQALPTFEGIQASLTEAQEALANDEQEVAQEAVQQAQALAQEAGAAQQEGQQAQEGQQQQDGALFSQSVSLEQGAYYTLLVTPQQGQTVQVGGQQQAGAAQDTQEEAPEGQTPAQQAAQEDQEGQQQDGQQQNQQQGQQQGQQVQIQMVQDQLNIPAAGAALLRVVHASPDAPALNLVVGQPQGQDGQQQDGQQQEGEQQQEGDGAQQAIDSVRQNAQAALDALDQDDIESARQSLQQAQDQIDQALQDASGDTQATLEEMQGQVQEALDALENEDVEAAREPLQQLTQAQDGQNQEGQQQEGQQQEGQQQEGQNQAGQQDQQGQGSLEIIISPQAAQGATVSVTGPDGYDQNFTGEQSLSELLPGTYVVSGTLRAYQPAATQAEVQADGTAQAELSFQRLASAGPPPIQGQIVVSDVQFATPSEYQQVRAATYTGQLRAVEGDLTALELRELQLQPGAAYTIFTYGSLRDDSLSATITVDVLVPQGQDQQGGQQGQQQEGQQQEGQAQEGQQQDGGGQEGQQAQGDLAQTLQTAHDSVQSALNQLEDDPEAAAQALQQAQDELAAATDSASGDQQEALQQIQQGIQDARTAIEEDDIEGARSTLQDVEAQLAEQVQQGQ